MSRFLPKIELNTMLFCADSLHSGVPGGSLAARSVLVIDDSGLIREAAKIALGTLGGWLVLTAESGERGLALASAEQPDAILLDLLMPGMDGIATAERLLAGPSACAAPIVFLTAAEQLEDRQRIARLPVAGVIAKPFDVATLAGELATLLHAWRTGA